MPERGWSTPIEDVHAGEVLRWYEGLEAQVVDFMRVVPPHGTNQGVWSSKIATVLVEACCLIESIFYQFRKDAACKQGKTLPKAKPGERDRLTVKNYADLYGSLLRLPERTAIFLTDTWEFRTPFAPWTDLVGGARYDKHKHELAWWNLYNSSKHDRITVFPEFTLTKAIDALAGALVVISTVPSFAPALVKHEWLSIDGWDPAGLVRDYWQTVQGKRVTPEEGRSKGWPFTIVTQRFALPIGHGHLPADIKEFHPLDFGASPRLLRHSLSY